MKYLISICLVLSCKFAEAQVDFTKDYYPAIYRAELAILSESYLEALSAYRTAFSFVQKPFARDYLNATVAALKTRDIKIALQYCDSLVAKGVPKQFFLDHQPLASLWQSKRGKIFLSGFENKYHKLNKWRDTSFAKVFIAMEKLDQEFRRKPNAYKIYGDTIKKIDSFNVAQLREIIRTHGFPNENMVNVTNPATNSFPALIVFHHYCQSLSLSREEKYNFLPDFVEAVRIGLLDPHQLAFLLSLQNEKTVELGGWGVMACSVNGVKSNLVGVLYDENKQKEIDSQRKIFGLDPLSEYYKKAIFGIRNEKAKAFAFGKYRAVNTFEMGTESECRQFLQATLALE